MLNIQKYENEILSEYRDISCDYMTDCDVYELLYSVASKHNKEVQDNWSLTSLLDWFLQEYKEPILNEKEKEYLSSVIKPFRNDVIDILKEDLDDYECITIYFKEEDGDKSIMSFPIFKKGTIYKGMKGDKDYTLEELGL